MAGRIRLNAGRKRPHWPKPRGIKQTALQFHPFLTPSVLPVDADLTTSLAFGIPSTHEAIGFDKGGDDSQALAAAVGPVQRLAVIRQKIGAGFPAVIAKRIGWTQRASSTFAGIHTTWFGSAAEEMRLFDGNPSHDITPASGRQRNQRLVDGAEQHSCCLAPSEGAQEPHKFVMNA